MSGLNVGDKLRLVNSGIGGSTVGPEVTVERLTPTGIAVLSNGERLNPKSRYGGWEVRGSTRGRGWASLIYRLTSSERVQSALREREAQMRDQRVDNAYDTWRRERTRDNLLRLIAEAEKAAQATR